MTKKKIIGELAVLLIVFVGTMYAVLYLTGILPIFYLGIILNVFCVVFMLILVFRTFLAESLLSKGLAFMERLPMISYKKSRHEKLHSGMGKYHETATFLKKISMQW